MSTDTPSDERSLPLLPGEPRLPDTSASGDVVSATEKPAEQLGFHLRFEAGKALLALEDRAASPGVKVRRALFEVPDVSFPLDVSGGALRFQNRRLTLRAAELTLAHDGLFVVEDLHRAGFSLARERARAGGLELVVHIDGPSGPVPVRARALFVAAGEGGVALVLHEILAFGPLPRGRLELAPALLDALSLPGGQKARAMVRRAEPLRAVFSRLLPAYGWKAPSLGEVRVHDVVFGKGEIVLRAWAGLPPEGWKAPTDQRRGPLDEAAALAVFADGLAAAQSEEARIRIVDALVDAGALAPSVIPFAAEVLRRSPRRTSEAHDLVAAALQQHKGHLALLSVNAEAQGIDAIDRARRLMEFGSAADAADEPWVSARAFAAAADFASNDLPMSLAAADKAWDVDPSLPSIGMLLARRLAQAGQSQRALHVGRQALERQASSSFVERVEDVEAAEAFAVELASVARVTEGIDAARTLLRRALRRLDRVDALVAAIDVEIAGHNLDSAGELLTRLLVLAEGQGDKGEVRKHVEVLTARLAEARGDLDAARLHLTNARSLAPDDVGVAAALARLHEKNGDGERALDVLQSTLSDEADARDAVVADALSLAARLHVQRGRVVDAGRALALIERLPTPAPRDERTAAEAHAILGETAPLGLLLAADAASASDSAQSAALRLRAARLLVDAGRPTDAALQVAGMLRDDVAGAVEFLAAAEGANAGFGSSADTGVALARTVATALLSTEHLPTLLDATSRLIERGRPRIAHAMLYGHDVVPGLRLRAAAAAAAHDVALEIIEQAALLHALPATELGERLDAWRRLAVLHTQAGGHGAAAAAQAWAAVADLGGPVDVGAWLSAALWVFQEQADAGPLARALLGQDVDVAGVASAALRAAIAALPPGDTSGTRRRLRGVLADRNEDVADVEGWLEDARSLPPADAAAALARAALASSRADWLCEALERLVDASDRRAAVACAISAPERLFADRALADRAFHIVVEASESGFATSEDLELAARRLLRHEPASEWALKVLIPRLLGRQALADAYAVLQTARTAGDTEAVREHLVALRKQAEETAATLVEIQSAELLVGCHVPEVVRRGLLRRLSALWAIGGNLARAAAALRLLADLSPEDEQVALWLEVAALEEQADPHAAITALRMALAHAPDSAQASERLVAVLRTLDYQSGVVEELLRRAARLPARSGERYEALLQAGDVAIRLSRPEVARMSWLRAIPAGAAEPEREAQALERLLALARSTGSRRLAIRALLRAARNDAGASAASRAAEAGALLAGVLHRPALAAVAYSFAEQHADDATPYLRSLAAVYGAMQDGPRLIATLDRLLASSDGVGEGALLFEARADARAHLLGDDDGAIEDRRVALQTDPTLAVAARALARQLRQRGDVRGALEVERDWVDAALSDTPRGLAFARLAFTCDEELGDARMTADLAAAALRARDDLDVRRLEVRALQQAGDKEAAVAAARDLMARLPATAVQERIEQARTAATLLEELGDVSGAAFFLQGVLSEPSLAGSLAADVIVLASAELAARQGRPAQAAEILLAALQGRAREDHSPAWGSRVRARARAAAWLEQAGEPERALSELIAAANDGLLDVDAEERRARLAESLGRPDVAAEALAALAAQQSSADATGLQRRLALAAEAAGELERALHAWQACSAADAQDEDAWRGIERLAVGEPRRIAAERLLELGAGDEVEQQLRAVFCAQDALRRCSDAGVALGYFVQAARQPLGAGTLREAIEVAEQVGDSGAARRFFDALALRTELTAGEALRSAELLLTTDPRDDGRAADLVLSTGDDALAGHLAGRAARVLAHCDVSVFAEATRVVPALRLAAAMSEHGDDAVRVAGSDVLPAVATAFLDRQKRGELLPVLEALLPALRRNPRLRQDALTALRDLEAWDAAATVLEDAVHAAPAGSAAQRDLRLELVSVLREGLADPAAERRAAPHLHALVQRDPDDREAWGELFECLDHLQERDVLQEALGRRAERVAGIERRELVRRRTLLLIEIGRGVEGLEQLREVRARAPGDAELKELERRIQAELGPLPLARFLADELRLQPNPADAAALLGLPVEATLVADRLAAHQALIVDSDSAHRQAQFILNDSGTVESKIFGCVHIAAALTDALRSEFLAEVARGLSTWPDEAVLALADSLTARHVVFGAASDAPSDAASPSDAAFNAGSNAGLALLVALVRWRTRGPRAAAFDLAMLPTNVGLSLRARLAARLGDRTALATLAPLLPSPAQAFVAADATTAARARAELLERSQSAPKPVAMAWMRIRHGDRGVLSGLRWLSQDEQLCLARRARAFRLTRPRLPILLELELLELEKRAAGDGTERFERIGRIADAALAVELDAVALAALDFLADQTSLGGQRLVQRADVAARLGRSDAAHLAAVAAEYLSPQDARAPVLWRRALDGFVQAEASADVTRALLGLAACGGAAHADALATAQALGLFQIADTFMGEAAAAADPVARRAAVRQRADLRRKNGDVLGAFDLLAQAADGELRQDAWLLAAMEGLVEQQLQVVDDDYAKAGLLVCLGRYREAAEMAALCTGPASAWLRKDIAGAQQDVAGEIAALMELGRDHLIDRGGLRRWLQLARDPDEQIEAAELLAGRFYDAAPLVAALRAFPAASSARHAAQRLQTMLAAHELSSDLVEEALIATMEVAKHAGEIEEAREARLAVLARQDDDAAWLRFLQDEGPSATAEVLAGWLWPLLGKPTVVEGALALLPATSIAAALRALGLGGQAASMVEALRPHAASLPMEALTPWAMALQDVGALQEAASTWLRLAGYADGSSQQQQQQHEMVLHAARLLLDAGDIDAAAEAVTGLSPGAADESFIAVAREALQRSSAPSWRLALRLADCSGNEEDVDWALRIAAAGGHASAVAVAAWRLRSTPRDFRAWRLLATLGDGEQSLFFQRALALREAGPWPEDIDSSFAKVKMLRARSVPHPPGPTPQTLVARARAGDRSAFGALAEAALAHGDVDAGARLWMLSRQALDEAPLELRLVLDGALGAPDKRVAAVLQALPGTHAAGRDVGPLLAAFDQLTTRGYTSAADRIQARAYRAPTGPGPALLAAIDDGSAVGAKDISEVLRALGRAPTANLRATAAAWLAPRAPGLARLLHPAVSSTDSFSTCGEQARADRLRAAADGDSLQALGALRALQVIRADAAVEPRIEALARDLGRFDIVEESLGRSILFASSPIDKAEALAARARVLLSQDPRGAIDDARRAFWLTADPAYATLWRQLAMASGDGEATAEALAAQAAAAGDPATRARALIERAFVLGRTAPQEGLKAIDDALAPPPEGVGVRADLMEARARLLLALHERAGAADALLAAAALVDPQSGVPLRREAANLLVEAGSVDEAVDVLCSGASEHDPTALADAEELARAHGSREILSRVLELRQGEVQDPMQRRLFVLERARVLNDIGDREAARALLEVQAQEDTGDVGVRLLLAEWYLGDRRMLDAALAYESVAVLPGVPLAAQGSAAREAASLLAALGDLERAGPLAQRAIHAGLVNLDLLAVAEAWHRGHERYADVDDLLGRELAHLDDPRRRAHVWMERAAVRRDRLGDLEGATQAVDAALREAPDSAMALESLRDEARRTRDFLPLVRGLSAAADSAHQPERRAELYRELAVFQLDELQDFAAAEDSIARALTVRPDEPASLLLKASLFARAGRLEGASELVRQLEERGFDDLPGALWLLDGDARRQAGDLAGARTRYARATEDGETKDLAWDRLIEIAPSDPERAHTLQSARAATSNRARSLLLLRQEAEQRGRIEDADGAIACLQLILDAEPDDSAALAEIAELLRKRRRLRELTPLWVAHARAGADAAERAHRLVAVACFAYDELGQEAPARALFEEALALVPDEPVALIRLADIAWAAHDDARALPLLDAIWPELWAAMPGERGAVREPAELAFRRARCATGLGHPDARQRLEAVLKAEPRHLEALDMLVKLTRAAGDTAAAAAALGTLAGALSERDDPIRVASVYLEFAEIRAEQGKVDEALAAAEHAFRLDPTSAAVLEAVAIAREAAGQAVNAAEAWRRVAALKSGGERRGALERRARGLGAGGRFADAIDALLELVEETGDPRYRTEAEEVARTSGQPDLLRRLGLRTRTPAPVRTQLEVPPITLSVPPETPAVSPVTAPVAVPGAARNTVSEHTDPMQSAARDRAAVTIQMRANLDDNDPQTALRLVLDALPGGLGDEAARLGLVAAERALAWDSYVAIAEARLKESLAPAEVKTVALGAGRVARDHLMDYDRAAAFLYQAHQADAEDLAVRFELTELYARIPRLASHAVTGILQLLRRAPTDPRFFLLSAELAESQGQQERAWAMKGIAQALSGRGLLAEAFSAPSGPSASQPLDQETLAARLAPTGWNGPLQQIFSLLGVHLEVATGNLPPPPRDARPLIHAAPGAAALVDKVDRLLPGRALQLLVDDVMMPYVAAAGIPQAILPQDALPHETLLLALIARATAVVRFVGVVVEGMPAESDVDLIGLLRGGLLGEGTRDARTELLTSRMRPADRDAALLLAPAALRQPDLAGTRAILIRAADRFALLATGSLLAALSAGPLPGLWKESPQRALGLLQTSQRGLELCAFAARDNVWLLRRQLGIGKSDR